MSTPLSVSIPHQLGRAEARRRIETGFGKLIQQLSGGRGTSRQRWDGDCLTFTVSGLGQTASGVIEVLDASVRMDLELQGVLGLLAFGPPRPPSESRAVAARQEVVLLLSSAEVKPRRR